MARRAKRVETEGAQGRYNERMRAPSRTHKRAKQLRRSLSPPEVRLWLRIRRRQPGEPVFRRQHPIGPYVADFCCADARLAIEIDGADHRQPERIARDAARDRYMADEGWTVLRISAAAVMADPDEVAHGLFVTAREMLARRASDGG